MTTQEFPRLILQQHPPLSYMGEEFQYRSGDGSRNSFIFPKLGAANTPYARSVNRALQTDNLRKLQANGFQH
jgi:hypothetical protein